MAEFAKTVGDAVVQIIAFNPKRTAVLFHNRGGSEVFVSQDKTDVLIEGFPMPSGAVLSYITRDGDDPRMARYGITAVGTGDVRISEQFGIE